MKEPENIQEVASLSPDFMGFIFYERSPRYVGKAFKVPVIGSKINRVGVFVNQTFEFIAKQSGENSLTYVQLHGNETPGLCRQLKSEGMKLIKAFSVDSRFDFESVKSFESSVDYFLFDTRGSNFGGTGRAFDWSLLNKYSDPTPFFLSGGLSADNIGLVSSIKNTALAVVDLNSGVEERPGKKDISKLKNIFTQLNRN